jgi:hypothetical protein
VYIEDALRTGNTEAIRVYMSAVLQAECLSPEEKVRILKVGKVNSERRSELVVTPYPFLGCRDVETLECYMSEVLQAGSLTLRDKEALLAIVASGNSFDYELFEADPKVLKAYISKILQAECFSVAQRGAILKRMGCSGTPRFKRGGAEFLLISMDDRKIRVFTAYILALLQAPCLTSKQKVEVFKALSFGVRTFCEAVMQLGDPMQVKRYVSLVLKEKSLCPEDRGQLLSLRSVHKYGIDERYQQRFIGNFKIYISEILNTKRLTWTQKRAILSVQKKSFSMDVNVWFFGQSAQEVFDIYMSEVLQASLTPEQKIELLLPENWQKEVSWLCSITDLGQVEIMKGYISKVLRAKSLRRAHKEQLLARGQLEIHWGHEENFRTCMLEILQAPLAPEEKIELLLSRETMGIYSSIDRRQIRDLGEKVLDGYGTVLKRYISMVRQVESLSPEHEACLLSLHRLRFFGCNDRNFLIYVSEILRAECFSWDQKITILITDPSRRLLNVLLKEHEVTAVVRYIATIVRAELPQDQIMALLGAYDEQGRSVLHRVFDELPIESVKSCFSRLASIKNLTSPQRVHLLSAKHQDLRGEEKKEYSYIYNIMEPNSRDLVAFYIQLVLEAEIAIEEKRAVLLQPMLRFKDFLGWESSVINYMCAIADLAYADAKQKGKIFSAKRGLIEHHFLNALSEGQSTQISVHISLLDLLELDEHRVQELLKGETACIWKELCRAICSPVREQRDTALMFFTAVMKLDHLSKYAKRNFLECNIDGKSALLCMLTEGRSEALTCYMKILQSGRLYSILNQEYLADLLANKDRDGIPILQRIIYECSSELLRTYLEGILYFGFDFKTRIKLLAAKNEEPLLLSCLTDSMLEAHQVLQSNVDTFFKVIAESEDSTAAQLQLLAAKNRAGEAILVRLFAQKQELAVNVYVSAVLCAGLRQEVVAKLLLVGDWFNLAVKGQQTWVVKAYMSAVLQTCYDLYRSCPAEQDKILWILHLNEFKGMRTDHILKKYGRKMVGTIRSAVCESSLPFNKKLDLLLGNNLYMYDYSMARWVLEERSISNDRKKELLMSMLEANCSFSARQVLHTFLIPIIAAVPFVGALVCVGADEKERMLLKHREKMDKFLCDALIGGLWGYVQAYIRILDLLELNETRMQELLRGKESCIYKEIHNVMIGPFDQQRWEAARAYFDEVMNLRRLDKFMKLNVLANKINEQSLLYCMLSDNSKVIIPYIETLESLMGAYGEFDLADLVPLLADKDREGIPILQAIICESNHLTLQSYLGAILRSGLDLEQKIELLAGGNETTFLLSILADFDDKLIEEYSDLEANVCVYVRTIASSGFSEAIQLALLAARDKDGKPILSRLLAQGYGGAVKIYVLALLRAKLTVTVMQKLLFGRDEKEGSILHYALSAGWSEVVQAYLNLVLQLQIDKAGQIKLLAGSCEGPPSLYWALENGCTDAVRIYLAMVGAISTLTPEEKLDLLYPRHPVEGYGFFATPHRKTIDVYHELMLQLGFKSAA